MRYGLISSVAALALLAGPAAASTVINFEAYTTDDEVLANPVELLDSTGSPSGATLSVRSGSTASIEFVGSDATDGFVVDGQGVNDDEFPGSAFEGQLGDKFLRATAGLSAQFPTGDAIFTLTFGPQVSSVSGELWDIDGNQTQGTEQWVVQAFAADNSLLDELTSPLGSTTGAGSLNGLPWTFSFAGIGKISYIEFDFTGSKTFGIGAALDNIEFTPVPLPASALLLLGGIGGLAAFKRRRKAA